MDAFESMHQLYLSIQYQCYDTIQLFNKQNKLIF